MRLLLRSTLMVLCVALGIAPLLAAPSTPQIYIGSSLVETDSAPLVQDGDILVPLSFHYRGLSITVRTDGGTVVLSGPEGLEARVPYQMVGGIAYYSITRACQGLRLGTRWVERQQRLYLAPLIYAVQPEMFDRLLTLRISSAYPVPSKVEVLQNPSRLLVEVSNAQLYTENLNIPVRQGGVTSVRAAQYSYDPNVVRVVVDLEGAPRYRVLSHGAATQTRVRVGVPEQLDTAGIAAIDRLLYAPDTEAPAVSAAIDITGVEVTTASKENTQVVIRTTGSTRTEVVRLSNPPRLALDIEDAAIRTQPPTITANSPLLRNVRLGQYAERTARVVLDLSEEVEFALSNGPDPGTLVLNLKSMLGKAPVVGLKNLRIMVDAGHGGSLSGTTGLSGRREQDINLDVAKRLYQLLKEAGADVRMTRFGDDTVNLRARPERANAQQVQVFVSIHCNANGRANSARGIETYYTWPHSLPLARAVHKRVVQELQAPDRQVRKKGFVVIKETKMPSILVEIGYMNHRIEDELLGTPQYRQRVARAIYNGIADYATGRKFVSVADTKDAQAEAQVEEEGTIADVDTDNTSPLPGEEQQ